MFSINNKMISSVPIHHNSFTNELLWRNAHFPMKQESLDDSETHVSPEIFASTEMIDTENDLDQLKSRSDHLARFIPPTISTSPTMATHHGIYVSPTYQQRDLSAHFKMSPNRMSPYRRSPKLGQHKTSPTSILSSPSPSSVYHQKISPTGCDIYQSSTPEKFCASPSRHSDLYRTSPNISTDYHHISPTSHTSGVSSHFSSDQFQSPQSYSHLSPSLGMGQFPNDIYRSLNFNLPKTAGDTQSLSPRMNITNDEPLNMNSKQLDLSQRNPRLSPYSNIGRSPSYLGNSPPNFNEQPHGLLNNTSSENPPLHQESHDSIDNSRSPSPIQNLKDRIKQSSPETLWNSEASAPAVDCTNDIPSLKCYFCSYNTKSRIQLNKHMRDAHNESKIMPYQHNKESTNESEDENENETHSNLSEDFMMDEYDEEDPECEEFAVNISKVSQNANNNKRTNYKCKKCTLTFKDKDEYYVHQKENHIKKEKLLECKLCPFVTEYKHHHEYHIKNHFKMKPFKCSYSNCKYSCNNQSMLNSHVKSHKSFYQFHCKNCNYATKYMHSFKLHLRKNNHEKGITLNEDGSVNNDIIIDIHGTRRGPKRKSRKLDDIALQNINNNNCITETIKKTIHHEPESEYNNNVTMSSNNGSSRSNSPLSSVNYNNNNNNDNYYLNTKLFVYSHMTSMLNEKTPEIWPKNFAKTNIATVPEVVDLSDIPVDVEAPLDLSKSVDTKPQHINDIEEAHNLSSNEVSHTAVVNKTRPQGSQRQNVDTNNALIKIENKVKTSADMIRIVGKNNFNLSHGHVFKNKNRIKLCKNGEKSIKNVAEKNLKAEVDLQTNGTENKIGVSNMNDDVTPVGTIVDTTQIESNISPAETNRDVDNDVEVCDKIEETDITINEKSTKNEISAEMTTDIHQKSPDEDTISVTEATQRVISSNKNRRRKGKAYKLQVHSDFVENVSDELNVEEEHKSHEIIIQPDHISPKFDTINAVNQEHQKDSTLPSTFEAIQMDYLKQIQNQYFKTFQQNKCLENCAVPPPHPILTNLNNNINSSQLFDSKSQLLSNYQQATDDFVGSHLKNLERINSHLLQNSLNIRQKSEGLKSFDNILSKKADAQKNLMNFLNKRNEMSHNISNNNRLWYKCELCDIQYLDELIYSIHMRYHNVEHPYKCNLCGLQTNNKFQFNLHIIQTPH